MPEVAIRMEPVQLITGTPFTHNGEIYDRVAVVYRWGGVIHTQRPVGVYPTTVTHTWNKHHDIWTVAVGLEAHDLNYGVYPRIVVPTDDMGLPDAPILQLDSAHRLIYFQVPQIIEAFKQAQAVATSIHQQLVIPIRQGKFELPTEL